MVETAGRRRQRRPSIVSAGDKPGWVCLRPRRCARCSRDHRATASSPPIFARTLARREEGARRLTVEARGRERSVMGQIDDARIGALVDRVRRRAEPWLLAAPARAGRQHARRFSEETAWFETHPDRGRAERSADRPCAGDRSAAPTTATPSAPSTCSPRFDRLGDAVQAGADRRHRRAPEAAADQRQPQPPPLRAPARHRPGRRLPGARRRARRARRRRRSRGSPRRSPPRSSRRWRSPIRAPSSASRRSNRRPERAPPSDQLIALANGDGDERVRVKALERLAEVGDEQSSATLAAIATSTETPKSVQAQALRLLGRVPLDDALATLTRFAREGDPCLASAALEGLSRRGDEAAAAALDGIARERGAADPLGRLALGAIKGLPHALAADRLRRLMNEAPDELKREAACALADLGEMDAAPALFADLEDAARHPRAVRLLTYLFCQDVGTESFKFRSLYESRPGVHPCAALRRGVARRRCDRAGQREPDGSRPRPGAGRGRRGQALVRPALRPRGARGADRALARRAGGERERGRGRRSRQALARGDVDASAGQRSTLMTESSERTRPAAPATSRLAEAAALLRRIDAAVRASSSASAS